MLKKCSYRVLSEKNGQQQKRGLPVQRTQPTQRAHRTDNLVLFLISSSLVKFPVRKFTLR